MSTTKVKMSILHLLQINLQPKFKVQYSTFEGFVSTVLYFKFWLQITVLNYRISKTDQVINITEFDTTKHPVSSEQVLYCTSNLVIK